MTTQATTQRPTHLIPSDSSSLVRRALLGNSIFSGLSGALFLLAAAPIATFLGLESALAIRIIGVMLLLYVPILYKTATAATINRPLVMTIIALDVGWVVGSMILIFGNILPLTTGGKWGIAIVADIVSVAAIAQYVGLRRL